MKVKKFLQRTHEEWGVGGNQDQIEHERTLAWAVVYHSTLNMYPEQRKVLFLHILRMGSLTVLEFIWRFVLFHEHDIFKFESV